MRLSRLIATWLVLSLCWISSCAAVGAPAAYGEIVASEYKDQLGGFADASGRPAYDDGVDGDMTRKGLDSFATPDPATAAPKDANAPRRQVIYSAALRLVVVAPNDAIERVKRFAEEAGGWLQESGADTITVRVPADKFEATLARIAGLGEVVARNVRASDVTEEMFDLELRLANARKTRDRLLEHLAASTKIEDTLAIEKELARVSEEIERMEGRQRFLASQVAMSTIRIDFNVLTPSTTGSTGAPATPFEWLGELGDGLVAGRMSSMPRKPGFFSRGPRFDPPADFIRYFSRDELVEAMNAEGLRLKVQRHENYDKGSAAFWTKLARASLVEGRALAITAERDLGDGRTLIRGTREVAGELCGYLLVLSRGSDRVYSFEAWGPAKAFDAAADGLVKSALTLTR